MKNYTSSLKNNTSIQKFPLIRNSLAVIIAASLLTACGAQEEEKVEIAARPVNVIELSTQDNLQAFRFSGVIKSHQTANLAFRVPGTIDEILVKEGDVVKKDQVIAKLDPHDYQVSVNELTARLNEAKAAHKLATVELRRTRMAAADNAVASVNLDRAVSGEARAAASVEMLKQSLKKAQDALRYTSLKAPFDGVIGQRFVDEHEQTSPGLSVVSIQQPNNLEAVVDVPEKQIGQFSKGLKGSVVWYQHTDGVPAEVTEVATLPDTLKRTYEVTFKLDAAPENLFPGKAVNVELETKLSSAAGTSTYCLPASAVKSLESQNQVVTVRDQKAVHVPVKVIEVRESDMCVEGALKNGDKVVTAGSNFLKEGQEISVLNTPGARS